MEAGRERHWIPAGQPKIRRLGPAVDLQAPQYTVESTGGTQDPGNIPEHAQVGLPELVIARDGSQARIVLLPGAELLNRVLERLLYLGLVPNLFTTALLSAHVF